MAVLKGLHLKVVCLIFALLYRLSVAQYNYYGYQNFGSTGGYGGAGIAFDGGIYRSYSAYSSYGGYSGIYSNGIYSSSAPGHGYYPYYNYLSSSYPCHSFYGCGDSNYPNFNYPNYRNYGLNTAFASSSGGFAGASAQSGFYG